MPGSFKKRLVFVGSGHGHLYPLHRIKAFRKLGIDVTVVSPGTFWYSGMGPGMVAGIYSPLEHTIDVQGLVERGGGTFVHDEVVRIDAAQRRLVLSKGSVLPYDALSLNVGSEVGTPDLTGATEFGILVKPILNLLTLREKIIALKTNPSRSKVVVIGGGAAGCELTANLCHLHLRRDLEEGPTLVAAGPTLLEDYGLKAGAFMEKFLRTSGVTLYLDSKVTRVRDGELALENGDRLPFDLLVVATGIRPSPLIAASGLPVAPDGSLQVNCFLQCPLHPDTFGAGDCIGFDGGVLPRVGVYAVRQAPVLYHNLMAFLTGRQLSPFHPQHSYLSILNLGDGTALFAWKGFINRSRLAFWLKDWLDRRFIRQFSGRSGRQHGNTPTSRQSSIP
jgi:NADH dehydrogenase FAD-containing subunit